MVAVALSLGQAPDRHSPAERIDALFALQEGAGTRHNSFARPVYPDLSGQAIR